MEEIIDLIRKLPEDDKKQNASIILQDCPSKIRNRIFELIRTFWI